MEKINALSVKLSRKGMDMVLFLKAHPSIEAFFKKASASEDSVYDDNGDSSDVQGGVSKRSGKWLDQDGNGLSYYIKNKVLSRKVDDIQVMDNFGNGLTDGDRINVAFLRCVGISDGITIKTSDMLSFEEMRDYMERLANWAADFYKQNLVENEVTASITVELSGNTSRSDD